MWRFWQTWSHSSGALLEGLLAQFSEWSQALECSLHCLTMKVTHRCLRLLKARVGIQHLVLIYNCYPSVLTEREDCPEGKKRQLFEDIVTLQLQACGNEIITYLSKASGLCIFDLLLLLFVREYIRNFCLHDFFFFAVKLYHKTD